MPHSFSFCPWLLYGAQVVCYTIYLYDWELRLCGLQVSKTAAIHLSWLKTSMHLNRCAILFYNVCEKANYFLVAHSHKISWESDHGHLLWYWIFFVNSLFQNKDQRLTEKYEPTWVNRYIFKSGKKKIYIFF